MPLALNHGKNGSKNDKNKNNTHAGSLRFARAKLYEQSPNRKRHLVANSCFYLFVTRYDSTDRNACPARNTVPKLKVIPKLMCTPNLISRKTFLTVGLALAATPLLRYAPAHAATMDVTEVAPGVFVHQGRYEVQSPDNRGDISNASFVVGSEAVAVIDTSGSAVLGEELRDAIRAVTNKPIRYVINTHMHPDHVLGNAAFKQDKPTFVGHYKLALLDEIGKRNAARVVPGHGPKTMELPQALEPEQRYLSAIAGDVRRQIAEGKTLAEATKTAGFSEKDAWKLFDQYHVRNVTAAFAELEWE